MHHTRRSGKTSPLIFNPEIERTARHNRANQRSLRKPTTNSKMEPNNPNTPVNPNVTSHVATTSIPPQPPPVPPIPPPFNQPPTQPPPLQPNPPFPPNPNYQYPSVFDEGEPNMNYDPPPFATNQHAYYQRTRAHTDDWNDDYNGSESYEEYSDGYMDEEGPDPHYGGNQRAYHRRVRHGRQGPRMYNGVPHMGAPNPPLREPRAGFYADGVPRRNYHRPAQGVTTHFRPMVAQSTSPIVPPNQDGRTFEVRPQYLGYLPTFYGKPNEEPYLHLAEFENICGTIGGHGFSLDEVKLMMFQFTLKDQAKQWFLTLPAGSIRTWEQMQQVFLEEYYTMNRTTEARESIRAFQQHMGEPFHEAFTRFKDLLRRCPHHGIPKWELIKAFYDGLLPEDVREVNSTSNGTFLTNHEDVDWEFLERMSVISKRLASNRKTRGVSAKVVDLEAEKRIKSLERQVAQLTVGRGDEAKAVNSFPICSACGDLGHSDLECPGDSNRTAEVNQVYGDRRPFDMNSNTYHPGLRNHPNFRYGNASNQMNPNFQAPIQGQQQQNNPQPYQNRQQGCNQGYNQGYNQAGYNRGPQRNFNNQQGVSSSNNEASKTDAIFEMLKELKKDNDEMKKNFEEIRKNNQVRDKSHEALSRQVGQLAEEIANGRRDPGKLPSDTRRNPSHPSSSFQQTSNPSVNQITILRSGKTYDNNVSTPPQGRDGEVEDLTGREDSDSESEVEIFEKPITKKKVTFQNKPEILENDMEGNTIPFPQALLKSTSGSKGNKRGPQQEEIWEVFKQVKINIPLIDAIKQIPAYAKYMKEMCTQKRHNKVPKKIDLTGQVSAVLSGEIPPKMEDPGTPVISVQGAYMINMILDL
ncbi:hypothetical protein L1987_61269 [Smallanthus sonchifolius]|uniref:Uncharacterized protein n=1 Tax=Smallanthus sonchifolius TaxID=185202 RepID=A0ACB9DA98_9ASTR|nr:hypothetical protein L1987_61269 [Smallanthus sonchifolius]